MTQQQKAIGILTLFCTLTIFLRVYITQSYHFTFLLWNLFLAMIPFLLSEWMKKKSLSKTIVILLTSIWLLFLPNVPYIVTDFIHLHKTNNIWFDLVMIFSFAFTGIVIAIVSMLDIYKIVQKKWTTILANIFMFLITFLCGFGIYLGRFLRLNSWDVFTIPSQTFKKTILLFKNEHVWFVSLGFGSLLWIFFYAYKTLNQEPIKK